MKPHPNSQRGAALLVGLIMLVMLTLLALVSFKLGTGNLQIVGNAQQRKQAEAAAQGAIEKLVSTPTFTTAPTAVTTNVDVNGDGTNDVTVVVTPTCVSAQIIPVSVLDFTKAEDQNCLVMAVQDFGQVGRANNDSMCANTLWDVEAVATDSTTSAKYKINHGAAVRVDKNTLCP